MNQTPESSTTTQTYHRNNPASVNTYNPRYDPQTALR